MTRDGARERIGAICREAGMLEEEYPFMRERLVKLLKAERRRTLRKIREYRKVLQVIHDIDHALDELRRRLQAGGRKG